MHIPGAAYDVLSAGVPNIHMGNEHSCRLLVSTWPGTAISKQADERFLSPWLLLADKVKVTQFKNANKSYKYYCYNERDEK